MTSPRCPACHAPEHTLYHHHNGAAFYQCSACQTVFLSPLPSAEKVSEMYTDAYAGASTGYFSKVDKKMHRSRRRLAYLRRYAPSGVFLDVGCNGGFMVEAARQAGFDAHGLDLDKVSIDYARAHYPQNTFHLQTIEEYAQTHAQMFDLVYCSEVIEHVPDPQPFMAAVARVLKPNGYLFMTTPDVSHWRRPKDLITWDAYCPPSHCLYFTPDSLRALMERSGLTFVTKRWAWKPGMKLLSRKAA